MILRWIRTCSSFFLVNTTTGQTIVKNTAWLTAGKLGSRLLRLVIVIYAARVLGATSWGMFSYAASLIGVFAVLTDFGISPMLTRETAKDPRNAKPEIISTALYLKILLLSPAIICICFFASHLPALMGIAPLLGFFALILSLDTFRQLGFSIIKARERMEIQAGLYVLTNAVIVILGLLLLSRWPSVSSLTYAYTIGSLIGALATWFYLRSYIKNLFLTFDWALAKEMLKTAWPFAITVSLASIMIGTDILILGFLKPVEDVGFYSIADRVIQFLYAPALIIATSMFPVLARLAQTDDHQLKKLVGRTVRYMLYGLIPASGIGILIAPWAIPMVFGHAYSPSVLPIQILLTTIAIRFISTLLSHVLFAYDARRTLATFAFFGIVLNVVLDFLLIPQFGIAGAAVATSVVQALGLGYLWYSFSALIVKPALEDDNVRLP